MREQLMKIRLRSLDDLDNRTLAAKRTRQLLGDIVSDLGGPENVTAAQRQLVQRAAILGAYLEDIEFKWASGEEIPFAEYLVAVNAQRRVLATIGLERRSRDVTPSLADYLANKARARSASEVIDVEGDEEAA